MSNRFSRSSIKASTRKHDESFRCHAPGPGLYRRPCGGCPTAVGVRRRPQVSALPTGETPLMVAARTGVVDGVVSLLEHGADPLARESWMGQTALMWAAAERHASVVAPLVAGGAEVDGRSDAGFTPLTFAARLGHIDTVDALLDAGADIHQTASGWYRSRWWWP